MNSPKTLEEAMEIAKKKALADVHGFSESPFAAVQWRKTLPKEWQTQVEETIVEVYHTI